MRSNKQVIRDIVKVKELKRLKKELEDQIEELENSLKSEMKTRGKNILTLEGWTLKLTDTCSNVFDSKQFKLDHELLYNNYLKERTSSRFYILKEGNWYEGSN